MSDIPSAKPEHDFSFVTSEELIAELGKRHECCVVGIAIKKTTEMTEDAIFWSGPLTYCIGMATKMQTRFLEAMNRDSDAGFREKKEE